ncbi:MAG: YdiU family protein [Gammaproteobacteria bacterium]|nr:YdiU family protein [Gammaproteobacteria bacterium]
MALKFSNTYFSELADLGSVFQPAVFPDPQWLVVSDDVIELLQLPWQEKDQERFLRAFSGHQTLDGFQPLAQKYTGHQFGQYNPDLGDGRGVLLAELLTENGRWDLHVKGAGKTPYSRFGDGRAVLRSCIREFLASEALAGLGIATSRALGVYTTGESVQRETVEPGAALIRVCESHIRFGHFEYAYYQKDEALLKRLVEYTYEFVLPAQSKLTTDASSVKVDEKASAILQHATHRTAEMIAKWQAFGFCHGVMNTDNMSILGITFDFGPFGFLDQYDPSHICNHSDHSGRYAFDEQPGVGLWNLNALGHALSPLIEKEQIAEILKQYEPKLVNTYSELMRAKLGLFEKTKDDRQLLGEFLAIMKKDQADYTHTWRLLSDYNDPQSDVDELKFIDNFISRDLVKTWFAKYHQRLQLENSKVSERVELMKGINPKYVLRNYLAQQAIEAAEKGDTSQVERLFQVFKKPFEEQPEHQSLAKRPPDWSQSLSISCSS